MPGAFVKVAGISLCGVYVQMCQNNSEEVQEMMGSIATDCCFYAELLFKNFIFIIHGCCL